MECTNKLKQIGIALHNYHDTHNNLPPSSWQSNYGAWAIIITPFMEMTNIYSEYDFSKSWGDSANDILGNLRIPAYTCPSDTPRTSTYPYGEANYKHHNYVACVGNTGLYPMHRETNDDENAEGWIYQCLSTDTFVNTGAAFRARSDSKWQTEVCVPFASVTDGLSNTIGIGEYKQGFFIPTATVKWSDLRGLIWHGGTTIFSTYHAPNSTEPDYGSSNGTNGTSLKNAPLQPPTAFEILPCAHNGKVKKGYIYAARSFHPGGVNLCFLDGSVHFISDTVDMTTYRAMSTTNAGETVSL